MTATYNTSLTADKDKVRLYIGDTTVSSAIFSDEEINAVLLLYPNSILLAAAAMADAAAGKFSRSVSFSVEGLSISNSQKANSYRELARTLRQQAASGMGDGNFNSLIGEPFVGGTTVSGIQEVNGDNDRFDNRFAVQEDAAVTPEEINTSDF